MINKKKLKFITREDITGFLFVLPFILGFVWLFMKPLITSLVYTLHETTMGASGLELEYIGWENYRYALFGDAEFVKELINLAKDVVIKILVIMFISMFLAILLNEKFPGRLLFRAILFLPVIFSADQVMALFDGLGGADQLESNSNSFMMMGDELTGFIYELTQSFGTLAELIKSFTVYASSMFDLLWEAGIQIILFIIGLQAIPGYLYEVAKIEGVTKWETFWKITFPLLSPSILLCLIYTMIEYFNSSNNAIVKIIDANMMLKLGYACAQSWFYAVLIFILVLITYKIVTSKTIYLD